MFNWEVKTDIKAANAIILGKEKEDKGRPFKARFLQAGLVKYDFGVCLLKKETIDKFVNTFMACPVIINHKDNIDKEDVHGEINNIWFSPEDGWFWCSGYVDDNGAEKVEDGYNVSCQYRITEYSNNDKGKLHNGNKYDKEILNGVFEHLAIVKNPRYEDAYIAVNAIFATNGDKWITIKPNGEENKGRHLLLKDGETPGEAIQRVYGNKDQKQLFDTSEYKKTKEDYTKEKEDKQKQYDELEEKRKESEKQQKEKAIQAYINRKITPDELGKIVPDLSTKEWHELADKRMNTPEKQETGKEEKEKLTDYNNKYEERKQNKSVYIGTPELYVYSDKDKYNQKWWHVNLYGKDVDISNNGLYSDKTSSRKHAAQGIEKSYIKKLKQRLDENPEYKKAWLESGQSKNNEKLREVERKIKSEEYKKDFKVLEQNEKYTIGTNGNFYAIWHTKDYAPFEEQTPGKSSRDMFESFYNESGLNDDKEEKPEDETAEIYKEKFGSLDLSQMPKKYEKYASNSFINQFKDMLYDAVTDGIVNRLGE